MSLASSEPKGPRAVLTDRQEYWLLFSVTFVVFFAAAVVGRLFRSLRGSTKDALHHKSLFAEAKANGFSSLAFAFMG